MTILGVAFWFFVAFMVGSYLRYKYIHRNDEEPVSLTSAQIREEVRQAKLKNSASWYSKEDYDQDLKDDQEAKENRNA